MDKTAQAGDCDQCRCTDLYDIDLARRDQLLELGPANARQLHRDRDTLRQQFQRQLRDHRHIGGFGKGAGHELLSRRMDFHAHQYDRDWGPAP